MNVSIIATTEGYSTFIPAVYLWDGQSRVNLFVGKPITPTDNYPSWLANQHAQEQAYAWVREHMPALIPYLPEE